MPFSAVGYFGAVRTIDRIIGQNSGANQTGNRVFLAGLNAGRNSTVSDLLVIGSSALSTGLTDANLIGSIALGTQAAAASVSQGSGGTPLPGALTVIGYQALQNNVYGASSVVVGGQALQAAIADQANQLDANVTIGYQASYNVPLTILGVRNGDYRRNVVVGYQSAVVKSAAANKRGLIGCVVIGAQALGNYDAVGVTNIVGAIVIGDSAGLNFDANGTTGDAIIIGRNAALNLTSGASCVLIGSAVTAGAGITSSVAIAPNGTVNGSNCTIVGPGAAQAGGATDVILLGNGSNGGGQFSMYLGGGAHVLTGTRNITLGEAAGNGETAANTDRFIVETFIGGTRRGVMYGNLGSGNLIVGKSTPGTDRDLETINCTNALKLLNGSRGAGNPAGGGFLYVSAGALRYVGSAGTDTLLAAA